MNYQTSDPQNTTCGLPDAINKHSRRHVPFRVPQQASMRSRQARRHRLRYLCFVGHVTYMVDHDHEDT